MDDSSRAARPIKMDNKLSHQGESARFVRSSVLRSHRAVMEAGPNLLSANTMVPRRMRLAGKSRG